VANERKKKEEKEETEEPFETKGCLLMSLALLKGRQRRWRFSESKGAAERRSGGRVVLILAVSRDRLSADIVEGKLAQIDRNPKIKTRNSNI
jgi:hypothetical protein